MSQASDNHGRRHRFRAGAEVALPNGLNHGQVISIRQAGRDHDDIGQVPPDNVQKLRYVLDDLGLWGQLCNMQR